MPMYDPAQGVKDLLVTASEGTFGAATGWGIFVGPLPINNDTCIVINQTGGRNPYPHLLVNFPSVQVMVRGVPGGYQAARTKIGSVVDKLLGITDQTVGGDTWRAINQIGDVSYLGLDENKRPLFSANFSIIVLPASGTYRNSIT